MQKHRVKIALALLLVASLLLVSVAAVASQDAKIKDHRMGAKKKMDIDTVYHAIAVTGMTGDSVTFNILSSAVKDKSGNVTTFDHKTPVTVQYFFSNDTAVIARMNKSMNKSERPRPTRTAYADAKMNVAGASAVISTKNVTMKRVDNNTTEVQLSAFSVYLPDGTTKSYTLDTPVRAVKSRADRTMKIIGNPQFSADMKDALKGSAKFPAGAAPVPIKTIDAKK